MANSSISFIRTETAEEEFAFTSERSLDGGWPRARTCKREREEKMVRKVDADIDIGLDGRFRTECGLIYAATRKRMIPENGEKK